MAAQLILTLGIGLYGIVMTRYAVLYIPTVLFGTFTGLLYLLMSLVMIGGLVCTSVVCSFLPNGVFAQYQVPFFALGVSQLPCQHDM